MTTQLVVNEIRDVNLKSEISINSVVTLESSLNGQNTYKRGNQTPAGNRIDISHEFGLLAVVEKDTVEFIRLRDIHAMVEYLVKNPKVDPKLFVFDTCESVEIKGAQFVKFIMDGSLCVIVYEYKDDHKKITKFSVMELEDEEIFEHDNFAIIAEKAVTVKNVDFHKFGNNWGKLLFCVESVEKGLTVPKVVVFDIKKSQQALDDDDDDEIVLDDDFEWEIKRVRNLPDFTGATFIPSGLVAVSRKSHLAILDRDFHLLRSYAMSNPQVRMENLVAVNENMIVFDYFTDTKFRNLCVFDMRNVSASRYVKHVLGDNFNKRRCLYSQYVKDWDFFLVAANNYSFRKMCPEDVLNVFSENERNEFVIHNFESWRKKEDVGGKTDRTCDGFVVDLSYKKSVLVIMAHSSGLDVFRVSHMKKIPPKYEGKMKTLQWTENGAVSVGNRKISDEVIDSGDGNFEFQFQDPNDPPNVGKDEEISLRFPNLPKLNQENSKQQRQREMMKGKQRQQKRDFDAWENFDNLRQLEKKRDNTESLITYLITKVFADLNIIYDPQNSKSVSVFGNLLFRKAGKKEVPHPPQSLNISFPAADKTINLDERVITKLLFGVPNHSSDVLFDKIDDYLLYYHFFRELNMRDYEIFILEKVKNLQNLEDIIKLFYKSYFFYNEGSKDNNDDHKVNVDEILGNFDADDRKKLEFISPFNTNIFNIFTSRITEIKLDSRYVKIFESLNIYSSLLSFQVVDIHKIPRYSKVDFFSKIKNVYRNKLKRLYAMRKAINNIQLLTEDECVFPVTREIILYESSYFRALLKGSIREKVISVPLNSRECEIFIRFIYMKTFELSVDDFVSCLNILSVVCSRNREPVFEKLMLNELALMIKTSMIDPGKFWDYFPKFAHYFHPSFDKLNVNQKQFFLMLLKKAFELKMLRRFVEMAYENFKLNELMKAMETKVKLAEMKFSGRELTTGRLWNDLDLDDIDINNIEKLMKMRKKRRKRTTVDQIRELQGENSKKNPYNASSSSSSPKHAPPPPPTTLGFMTPDPVDQDVCCVIGCGNKVDANQGELRFSLKTISRDKFKLAFVVKNWDVVCDEHCRKDKEQSEVMKKKRKLQPPPTIEDAFIPAMDDLDVFDEPGAFVIPNLMKKVKKEDETKELKKETETENVLTELVKRSEKKVVSAAAAAAEETPKSKPDNESFVHETLNEFNTQFDEYAKKLKEAKSGLNETLTSSAGVKSDDGDEQKICCVVGCVKGVVVGRMRTKDECKCLTVGDFKGDYLKNGWDKICSFHYFSDVYKFKQLELEEGVQNDDDFLSSSIGDVRRQSDDKVFFDGQGKVQEENEESIKDKEESKIETVSADNVTSMNVDESVDFDAKVDDVNQEEGKVVGEHNTAVETQQQTSSSDLDFFGASTGIQPPIVLDLLPGKVETAKEKKKKPKKVEFVFDMTYFGEELKAKTGPQEKEKVDKVGGEKEKLSPFAIAKKKDPLIDFGGSLGSYMFGEELKAKTDPQEKVDKDGGEKEKTSPFPVTKMIKKRPDPQSNDVDPFFTQSIKKPASDYVDQFAGIEGSSQSTFDWGDDRKPVSIWDDEGVVEGEGSTFGWDKEGLNDGNDGWNEEKEDRSDGNDMSNEDEAFGENGTPGSIWDATIQSFNVLESDNDGFGQ